MNMRVQGKLVTFEGSEGSGKSTQIEMLYKYLKSKGRDVLFLREPGGVKISETIRNILLDVNNSEMGDECETLLYMAARAQLVKEVVEPQLKAGKIIICDRFLDSTVVYQGYGRGVDIKFIKLLGKFATQSISPDLTFVFDIQAKEGLARIRREKDRIEKRDLSYHNRVRNGYLSLARQEPKRIKVIKSNQSREEIQKIIRGYINPLLKIKD